MCAENVALANEMLLQKKNICMHGYAWLNAIEIYSTMF